MFDEVIVGDIIVKLTCSTLVELLAEVSKNGMLNWSAYSLKKKRI
jgi:hypothetical protein